MKVLWFCLVLTILNPIGGFYIPPKNMRISDEEIREIPTVNPGNQPRLTYFDYPPLKSFLLEELMAKMKQWRNGEI